MVTATTAPIRFVTLGLVLLAVLASGCGPGASDVASDTQSAGFADEGALPADEGGAAPPSDAGADAGSEGPPQVGGAAALGGPRITSLDDLATWIQASTGSCADATTVDRDIPDALDDIYEDTEDEPFLRDITPLVSGVGRCTVDHPDGSTLYVKMVLFEEGSFPEVQRVWKTHSTERPPDSWALFGNGYTLHGIEDRPEMAAALGVMYLRCGEDDGLGGQQMPADVDGCFFTTIR